MTDPVLFKVKPAHVGRAQKLAAGTSRPVWSRYTLINPVKCQDCCQLVLDALQAGGTGPPIRQARMKRKQGATTGLFCQEHGNQHQADDKEEWEK